MSNRKTQDFLSTPTSLNNNIMFNGHQVWYTKKNVSSLKDNISEIALNKLPLDSKFKYESDEAKYRLAIKRLLKKYGMNIEPIKNYPTKILGEILDLVKLRFRRGIESI